MNRAPPLLSSLFEDLLAQAPPGVAQAISSGTAGGWTAADPALLHLSCFVHPPSPHQNVMP
jgi:hypothetical protein